MRKDWPVNEEALEHLLGLLDSNPMNARQKYDKIRAKLTKLFQWRGCPSPEEYAIKTIDGAAKELFEGKRLQLNNPYLYFHRIAINVSNALKEQWLAMEREAAATPTDGSGRAYLAVADNGLNRQREEQRVECLRECLKTLSAESLELITKYHQTGGQPTRESRKELARSLGITQAELRLRVFRIRANLASSVANCLGRSKSIPATRNGDFFKH